MSSTKQQTSTALEKADKAPRTLIYDVGGQEVSLTARVIRDLLVKGKKDTVTDAEVWQFGLLCQHQRLDPFVGDAYLVKYGDDAQMLVSKAAFMKRAEACASYAGLEAGVTIEINGELVQRPGSLVPPGAKLIGGWARVYRTDRGFPSYAEVAFSEYNKGRSTWKDIPATMIRKVAIVHAMREAYPVQLGGLYTEDELVASGRMDARSTTWVDKGKEVQGRLTAAKDKAKAATTQPEPEMQIIDVETTPEPVLVEAVKRFGAEHVDAVECALAPKSQADLFVVLERALSYQGDPPTPGSIEWEIYIDSLRAEEGSK